MRPDRFLNYLKKNFSYSCKLYKGFQFSKTVFILYSSRGMS